MMTKRFRAIKYTKRIQTRDLGSNWTKSSLSGANGNCVEVADLSGDPIKVRNSRDANGPILRFTPAEWDAFLAGVRNGEFDRRSGPNMLN
jgi:Domain of unknown function (DUF397)